MEEFLVKLSQALSLSDFLIVNETSLSLSLSLSHDRAQGQAFSQLSTPVTLSPIPVN